MIKYVVVVAMTYHSSDIRALHDLLTTIINIANYCSRHTAKQVLCYIHWQLGISASVRHDRLHENLADVAGFLFNDSVKTPLELFFFLLA